MSIAFAAFIAGLPGLGCSQPMLLNPSFEVGSAGAIEGWHGTTNAGDAVFSRTRESPHSGEWAARIVATPDDVYARWVYARADLFAGVRLRDRLRLTFWYRATSSLGDALVQVNSPTPPGWRQYTLPPLEQTGGEWRQYVAELTVDVVPSGSGEVQLRATTAETGDQAADFDDIALEVVGSQPPPTSLAFPQPEGPAQMITPTEIRAICYDASALPICTAAQELQRFLGERTDGKPPDLHALDESQGQVPPGAVVLGTPRSPVMGALLGRQAVRPSDAVDSYEIRAADGRIVIVGANPRAVVYGAFELEDLLMQLGGLPADWRVRRRPALSDRLLHPRARGGFHEYERADIEFIARAGGNVAHLTHDWMSEKTLFSFVPSEEFPEATDAETLTRNREALRRYIDWCNLCGLRVALWLCELPCQGGPWTPEATRERFLTRYPAEALSDTGTYQGQVLCLAHPRVERAYRQAVRRLLSDFPELEMVLVFTLDSNGELCDPERCPRHAGVSKHEQYNRLLALLAEEGRSVRPSFRVHSVGWSWRFRGDPAYLDGLARLPVGTGLATLPDGEAWSFDRKVTDSLVEWRQAAKQEGQTFLGYDIFLWGDDCQFPETELYDFPLGVAAKLRRWESLQADGLFDQWGTQAEFVPVNAVALRAMLFDPRLTSPKAARQLAARIAEHHYGQAAAGHVLQAWEEIESAQQIQSDHTYYWHALRPNWSGAVLESPLSVEALQACSMSATEPPKPYRDIDYCGCAGDEVACAQALGDALPMAADHFARAAEHLQGAIDAIDPGQRSAYEHWYPFTDDSTRTRLTPAEALQKQLVSVSTQERVQRQMGWFFQAFALVRTMPGASEPGHDEALARLAQIRERAGR